MDDLGGIADWTLVINGAVRSSWSRRPGLSHRTLAEAAPLKPRRTDRAVDHPGSSRRCRPHRPYRARSSRRRGDRASTLSRKCAAMIVSDERRSGSGRCRSAVISSSAIIATRSARLCSDAMLLAAVQDPCCGATPGREYPNPAPIGSALAWTCPPLVKSTHGGTTQCGAAPLRHEW